MCSHWLKKWFWLIAIMYGFTWHHASRSAELLDRIDLAIVATNAACDTSLAIRSAEIEGGVDRDLIRDLRTCAIHRIEVHAKGTDIEVRAIAADWLAALGRLGTLNSCDNLRDCADTVVSECTKAGKTGCSSGLVADLTGRSTYNQTNCEGKCCDGTKITRYCIVFGPIVQK